MMALEKVPMWPVPLVSQARYSYTLGDVLVVLACDTRCEQRQGNNELIRGIFSLLLAYSKYLSTAQELD